MAARDPMQDSDMSYCINMCATCYKECLETLHHCLGQKRTHFQGKHLELLQICAESCDLALKMMVADMEFHRQSCELCFEVCFACAEECEKISEDEVLLHTAEICRKCGESCRAMAGMTVTISANAKDQKPRGIVQ